MNQPVDMARCTIVLEGNSCIFKNKGIFVWNFVPNSELSSFLSSRQVDRRKCFQHSSTDDRHQFITLSVHLRLQRSGRDKVTSFSLFFLRKWSSL